MQKYIMALDAGTTSNRCVLFDQAGNIQAVAQKEFTQYFPKPGWVEHDPKEIWSTQIGVIMEAMAKLNIEPGDICGIGITNQRETTVVWDKETGEPIYNAIVWQCRRTAEMAKKLTEDGYNKMIREKTGLIVDPYFSATKIRWILDHVEGAQERAERGELLFGTIDTWLIWKLTRGTRHCTDYSNASRTMLFNIHTLTWDREILELLRIPEVMLPKVLPSSGDYGMAIIANREIPIAGAAGDQQCALFGQTCFAEGEAKNTYGTGAFLLMNTGNKAVRSKNGLLTTIAWGLEPGKVTYALEGSIFVAGSSVQWLRDQLRIVDSAEDTEYYATRVPDTGGVYVVPAFTGLGAPYWDPFARGVIVGITRGTNRYHIIRATLEAQAFLSNDVLQAMANDLGTPLKNIRVDGGAVANNFLMQFQANMSQVEVRRPKVLETTALGAAYLAGLATGFWSSEELPGLWKEDRVFLPEISVEERNRLDRNWQYAIDRSFSWAKQVQE
ncbi:MAG: glycerol kinase GlpK [Peptoniphilaceae bacterium]|nr:glycerol kinase GlpK [Peptoniphilaceae bacterium]MDD7543717.1 glycerol kinase GlpK [Peptoniphilaceae bacterium]MDY3075492.1 glycerol kinase GlpK [Peptoniphilaceae bacterium]MDY5766311.1 glycerol kinase GlpK [Peptoniphilaceae bacterium]MDY5842714.1 glycerol kinase GlpK [Peptoniphilaceae bacterium]